MVLGVGKKPKTSTMIMLIFSTVRCQLLFPSSLAGKKEKSDEETLIEYLDSEIDDKFNLELDDGSIEQVVAHTIGLYIECVRKDFEPLNKFLAMTSSIGSPNNVIWGGKVCFIRLKSFSCVEISILPSPKGRGGCPARARARSRGSRGRG